MVTYNYSKIKQRRIVTNSVTVVTYNNSKIKQVRIVKSSISVTVGYYLSDILADKGSFNESLWAPHAPALALIIRVKLLFVDKFK